MENALVIVESPAKAKTIRKYLGKGYEVMASVGHILDLPPRSMGVDLQSGQFTPEYEPILGKAKVISELKRNSKKADVIYLAPDPDREGEAIAFHLAKVIEEARPKNVPQIARVRFHELTKKAIQYAFAHPDKLNQHLYDAQQARRILDRVVGYQISPILWKKVQRGLSAGRVQSVAVRLVVDREREVEAFVKEEYWTVEAEAEGAKKPIFTLKLARIHGKKAELHNEAQALEVKTALEKQNALIQSVQKKQRIRKPGPPFITSKLQQDAARAFRFSTKQTMALAQSLYEGVDLGEEGAVGLITYMRTDSTRISPEALQQVREHIVQVYGKEYLPEQPNFYKNKKSAQEAHEAIRPTSLNLTPEVVKPYLKKDQFKLYELIWDRFVASQMSPAIYDQTTIEVEKAPYLLRATGSVLRFYGFLKAYQEQVDEDDQEAKSEAEIEKTLLPDLEEGQKVFLKTVKAEQHFTEPPPRFTEASLVKELEEKGIGRPSTYASILSTIQEKGYTKKETGRFYPTELGRIVTDLLLESFPNIMSVAFTASMEEKLDQIEEGQANWVNILQAFYGPFEESVTIAQEQMRNIKRMEEQTDILCKKCGSPMVIKWGKNGSFLGCSTYPTCNYTVPYTRKDGQIVVEERQDVTNVTCKSCGAKMVQKRGRYGNFLGCSRYPDCSFTMPMPTNIKCPKDCGGDILQKRTHRGKEFFGCSNYPACDFVSWQMPVNQACSSCKNPYLVEKTSKEKVTWQCPMCKATFEPSASSSKSESSP